MTCTKCQQRIVKSKTVLKRWVHVNRDLDANHNAIPNFDIRIRGVLVDS